MAQEAQMNCRVILTVLLFSVVGIVTIAFVRGCAPILTGPKYHNSSATDASLTPAERKIAWQKMNKWRSIRGRWLENGKIESEN